MRYKLHMITETASFYTVPRSHKGHLKWTISGPKLAKRKSYWVVGLPFHTSGHCSCHKCQIFYGPPIVSFPDRYLAVDPVAVAGAVVEQQLHISEPLT